MVLSCLFKLELDLLRKLSVAGEKSVYNVCNLTPAVEIVNKDIDWDQELKESTPKTSRSTSSKSDSEQTLIKSSEAIKTANTSLSSGNQKHETPSSKNSFHLETPPPQYVTTAKMSTADSNEPCNDCIADLPQFLESKQSKDKPLRTTSKSSSLVTKDDLSQNKSGQNVLVKKPAPKNKLKAHSRGLGK